MEKTKEELIKIRLAMEKSEQFKTKQKKNKEELRSEIAKLNEKIEKIAKAVKPSDKDSDVKQDTKKKIINVIKKNQKLSSRQLGEIIGLSRTRSNEYLKELESERLVQGIFIGKKKFYMLNKK